MPDEDNPRGHKPWGVPCEPKRAYGRSAGGMTWISSVGGESMSLSTLSQRTALASGRDCRSPGGEDSKGAVMPLGGAERRAFGQLEEDEGISGCRDVRRGESTAVERAVDSGDGGHGQAVAHLSHSSSGSPAATPSVSSRPPRGVLKPDRLRATTPDSLFAPNTPNTKS